MSPRNMKRNLPHSLEYWIFMLLPLFVLDAVKGLYVSQESAIKVVNETFLVSCKDEAGRQVHWTGPRGDPIGFNSHPKLQTSSYGTSILFSPIVAEDSGKYECKSPSERKSFQLTVEAPLKFMDTPSEVKSEEGLQVMLRCEVSGGRVDWSNEDNSAIKDPRFSPLGDGLLVMNVSRNDAKTYFCKAVQQSTGNVQDRKIKLTVQYKPSFIKPETEKVYGFLNGFMNLSCEVEAEPPATFEWKTKPVREPTDGRGQNSTNISILQLKLDRSVFGQYKCIATNSVGSAEKRFILAEGVKLEPPEFVELKGSNSNLLDLGIRGPDNENITKDMHTTGYNVQYRVAHKKQDWENKKFNISKENSYPLKDLLQDITYEVRAAAQNVAGLSEYTNTSNFRTLKSEQGSDRKKNNKNNSHSLSSTLLTFYAACITVLHIHFETHW